MSRMKGMSGLFSTALLLLMAAQVGSTAAADERDEQIIGAPPVLDCCWGYGPENGILGGLGWFRRPVGD